MPRARTHRRRSRRRTAERRTRRSPAAPACRPAPPRPRRPPRAGRRRRRPRPPRRSVPRPAAPGTARTRARASSSSRSRASSARQHRAAEVHQHDDAVALIGGGDRLQDLHRVGAERGRRPGRPPPRSATRRACSISSARAIAASAEGPAVGDDDDPDHGDPPSALDAGRACRRPRRPAAPPRWRPGPGGRRCAPRGSWPVPCGPASGSWRRGRPRRPGSAARQRVAERRARRPARRPAPPSPGASASYMVLSPASALPRATTPSRPARSALASARRVQRLDVARGGGHPQEEGPVQRAAGPADRAHQRHPDLLEQRRRRWTGGFTSSAATTAVIPRSMFTPWSASPIAESSWVSSSFSLGDDPGELADPGRQRRDVDRLLIATATVHRRAHAQIPQRSAGVLTGASQSRSRSSSTLSSVTEQPAISRLVM